ncbi:hypothetical protein AGR4A_Lc10001 [Agrobacterium tumefaciens str. B6]|uniref:Uncharacterized protein n=1 Tax=Agrobacterium tumefaciens str. B6 TaxID=1183423 RepID=A0A822V580_AGRTU|nr:hypothetical protein AGR4A_Lc10001 [Agrobacterium tumefaciens str. B6]
MPVRKTSKNPPIKLPPSVSNGSLAIFYMFSHHSSINYMFNGDPSLSQVNDAPRSIVHSSL